MKPITNLNKYKDNKDKALCEEAFNSVADSGLFTSAEVEMFKLLRGEGKMDKLPFFTFDKDFDTGCREYLDIRADVVTIC